MMKVVIECCRSSSIDLQWLWLCKTMNWVSKSWRRWGNFCFIICLHFLLSWASSFLNILPCFWAHGWNLSNVWVIPLTQHSFCLGVGCSYKQHLSCSVRFWCMLGGSVEVQTKNILNLFIERSNSFWPSGAQGVLPLMNWIGCPSLNLNTTFEHALQGERSY